MCKKPLTVKAVEEYLNTLAPFDTAEGFDNVGLIVGNGDAIVSDILVTLDVTMNAVQEAIKKGCQLIVTHHPLLFHARKRLVEDDPEARILCELIRNRISVIAAHTNLDASDLSGGYCIARALGLQNVRKDGFLVLGETVAAENANALKTQIEAVINAPVRIYGDENKSVATLAIAGGAYDEGYVQAKALGAQALLTGEVRHHNAIAAAMENFVLMDGTHWATEEILVPNLAASLQNGLCALKYYVNVYPSSAALFAGGAE